MLTTTAQYHDSSNNLINLLEDYTEITTSSSSV